MTERVIELKPLPFDQMSSNEYNCALADHVETFQVHRSSKYDTALAFFGKRDKRHGKKMIMVDLLTASAMDGDATIGVIGVDQPVADLVIIKPEPANSQMITRLVLTVAAAVLSTRFTCRSVRVYSSVNNLLADISRTLSLVRFILDIPTLIDTELPPSFQFDRDMDSARLIRILSEITRLDIEPPSRKSTRKLSAITSESLDKCPNAQRFIDTQLFTDNNISVDDTWLDMVDTAAEHDVVLHFAFKDDDDSDTTTTISSGSSNDDTMDDAVNTDWIKRFRKMGSEYNAVMNGLNATVTGPQTSFDAVRHIWQTRSGFVHVKSLLGLYAHYLADSAAVIMALDAEPHLIPDDEVRKCINVVGDVILWLVRVGYTLSPTRLFPEEKSKGGAWTMLSDAAQDSVPSRTLLQVYQDLRNGTWELEAVDAALKCHNELPIEDRLFTLCVGIDQVTRFCDLFVTWFFPQSLVEDNKVPTVASDTVLTFRDLSILCRIVRGKERIKFMA